MTCSLRFISSNYYFFRILTLRLARHHARSEIEMDESAVVGHCDCCMISFLIQLCNKIKRKFMFVIILKNGRKAPRRSGSKCGYKPRWKTQFPYKDDKSLIMLRLVVYTSAGTFFLCKLIGAIPCVKWEQRVRLDG